MCFNSLESNMSFERIMGLEVINAEEYQKYRENMIPILHISDFHYKPGKAHISKQKKLIEQFKLLDDLNEEVDFIIFSLLMKTEI